MSAKLHAADSPEVLFPAVAAHLIQLIGSRLEAQARVSIALGGGSTPRGLFDEWVQSHRKSIDWSRVLFFWGDERAVGPDDPESNFGMAHRHLLAPLEIVPQHIFRLEGERPNLDEAAKDAAAALQTSLPSNAAGVPVLDLVLLGMGDDAHTASLFPGTAALQERTRWIVANPVPKLQTTRLTMTYPVINAAAEVHFLVRGEGKAAALQAVLEGEQDVARWPSQGISATRVEWWVDTACASQLRNTTINSIT